ncbi:dihydrofolate reductase family protein [Blastococcus sp. TF02A-26]|uniref:dihydrofolate reductase family protein n=1 Tax=Blastococcus sp. TF02A-26 TaxID=2250577 RepID=UPI001F18A09C|nr:hypothetical protein [Blastococcus sp. TF02A-26]
MGKVVLFAAVSLDGYVGRDDDMPGPLFDWYGNGDVELTFSDPDRPFRVTAATAEHMREFAGRVGAMVCGRHLFDITNGWGGVPPNGEHAVVVTHRPVDDWPHLGTAPFTFVPDVRSGIERARELAGDRDVTVSAGDVRGDRRSARAWSTRWPSPWSRSSWGRGSASSAAGEARRCSWRTRSRWCGGGGCSTWSTTSAGDTGKVGWADGVAVSAPLRTRRAEREIMWPPPDPLETV